MTRFPFDIVGFDLDGTLLDTHGDLAHAVNHALALEGRRQVTREEVRGFVGGGARRLLLSALEATGEEIAPARFEYLHAELMDYYAANIAQETRLFPGGEAMLDGLASRGVKIGVVTNKAEHLAVQLFAELGLSQRFFTVIGGDTLGRERAKPKPDLLELMLERAGGGKAAYVGDTSYDTKAAQAAGLPCVVVRFGFNDRAPDELGGAAVIDHFDALIPALEQVGTKALS